MKKSLIALAALAAAGAASAQSSVTLFGIIDVAYTYQTATNAGKHHQLRSDGYNSSRLGFRGTEDLGGGMSASFWLEMGFTGDNGTGSNSSSNNTAVGDRIQFNSAPGNGASASYQQSSLGARQGLTFNRRSTVSLAGPFGELRLGRDYVPSFWNLTVFDPFGTNGVGSFNNIALGSLNPRATGAFPPGAAAPQVRSSNSVGYFLPPNLGGFYGQAMYAWAENPNRCNVPYLNNTGATGSAFGPLNCPGTPGDGRVFGARLGWASGPFNVAGAWTRTDYNNTQGTIAQIVGPGSFAAAAPVGYVGDYTAWNIGGQWDLGMARIMGQIGEQNTDNTATVGERSLRHYLIGGLVPVGAGEIRASFGWGKRDDSGAGGAGNQANNDNAKVRQWAIGYVHNFSKRTAVYTSYAHQRVTGGNGSIAAQVAPGINSIAVTGGARATARGFDIGVRHSF